MTYDAANLYKVTGRAFVEALFVVAISIIDINISLIILLVILGLKKMLVRKQRSI